MAITINGTANTVAGLAVGGLPDGTVDADTLASGAAVPADGSVTSTKITDGTITTTDCAAAVKSGLVKAWIYFDGTGTVGINDSFNVSSLTDNGTGDYQVNFTNNLANANYAVAGSSHVWSSHLSTIRAETQSTSSVNIEVIEDTRRDSDHVHAIIIGEQ